MARQGTSGMTEKFGTEEKMERDLEQGKMLRRRGLLAGAAAVAAGVVAAKTAESVKAGNGDIITVGSDISTITLETHLTGSTNQSTSLFHLTQNGQGKGLDVIATGNQAIYAWSGTNDGIYATSNVGGSSSAGVHGFGGGASGAGNGVIGEATGGGGAYGVWGKTDVGRGVNGTATGVGIGVQGTGGLYGVAGVTTTTNGVGVYGNNTGLGGSNHGVYGQSSTGYGVLGYSTGGSASLAGISTNINIPAFAGGNNIAGGIAAHFSGMVYVDGAFVVANMAQKHGLLKHPDGSSRLMYSVEAPESWAEDFGKGQLAAGRAEVKLDADFAPMVDMSDYHVFLTPRDPACKGLAVSAQRADGFTVQELNGGTSSGAFSWRLVAKPKTDKKSARLAKFEVPKTPPLPSASDLPKLPEMTKDATLGKPAQPSK